MNTKKIREILIKDEGNVIGIEIKGREKHRQKTFEYLLRVGMCRAFQGAGIAGST